VIVRREAEETKDGRVEAMDQDKRVLYSVKI
jgi:hypothetical protein